MSISEDRAPAALEKAAEACWGNGRGRERAGQVGVESWLLALPSCQEPSLEEKLRENPSLLPVSQMPIPWRAMVWVCCGKLCGQDFGSSGGSAPFKCCWDLLTRHLGKEREREIMDWQLCEYTKHSARNIKGSLASLGGYCIPMTEIVSVAL